MEKKPNNKEVQELKLDSIIPNRFQPRKDFDQPALQELMDSIKTSGVLEPIIVRQIPKTRAYQDHCPPNAEYEIIMGERRFRACETLKMDTIPAVVKEADDRQMLQWALIENTHRKDLNPIERARAYKQLADTFHLTHQQVAERVGVGRTTITDFIRLLSLPPEIQEDVGRQTIKIGHAMAILPIPDSTRRLALWQRVKNEDLSVRHLRILVDAYLHPRGVAVGAGRSPQQYKELHVGNDPQLRECAERLRQKLPDNIGVDIHHGKIGDQFLFGSISLSYRKEDDLQRILKAME
ncbi:ParB/RepB/Spo0J family partition protein [Candidatus Woesearchaeota archaeon]|nr:ParB/RepB/Spo0J family partition protein [Candidatus Woesearchaeota archaeon]